MNAPATVRSNYIKGATGDWEVVVGLEVHAQVSSQAKLFSGASTAFGGEPNTHVSLVDAAMPGMLPVINRECVAQAVRTGLALKATINPKSVFDRKNYFYPDLPQGYQISQYKSPIVSDGELLLPSEDNATVKVRIERIHLEQDAGKLLHDQRPGMSFVDLNRSGVALMEIVTKPDMSSSSDAMNFVASLRRILRYLGTCDGDMEKGNLRADVNVSVHRPNEPLGTRCEIKNVNSINFIGLAVEAEAHRQIAILEDGGIIDQETRLFDPDKGETRAMRSKEEAHDYRYFPDPDLLPLEITQREIDALKAKLPELPDDRRARFIREFGLSLYDASVLVDEKETAEFFEMVVKELGGGSANAKTAANWIINELFGRLNKTDPSKLRAMNAIGPVGLGHSTGFAATPPWSVVAVGPTGPAANTAILRSVSTGVISGRSAKVVLDTLWQEAIASGRPIDDPAVVPQVIRELGLVQENDMGAIEKAVDEVIAKNPDKVADAKTNPKAIGWFVGQVMKVSGGKANPQAVNDLLKAKLGL